jgi:hypothetical protein
MGSRTYLCLGQCWEIEANNCLPITWLALFGAQEFVIESREERGEQYQIAIYRTTRSSALNRVKQAIVKIKVQSSVWCYFRPLEILEHELQKCPLEESVILDVTQLWATNESLSYKVSQARSAFDAFVNDLTGHEAQNLDSLNQLIGDLALYPMTSVASLSGEDKMFILFGTYWGDPESESLYSLEFFGDEYWTAKR